MNCSLNKKNSAFTKHATALVVTEDQECTKGTVQHFNQALILA